MKYATKYNAADAFAGRVEYKYCLSCDGALSERIEYNSSWGEVSHKRYEYDGLNLVRVDEEYATNQWRTLETATHKPGALGSLVHKRVYTHTNGDATPDAWVDYTYGYDAVGNVYCVWDDDGNEVFSFAQDAFGNELPVDLYGQDSWNTARTFGINEHQTGKWIDPFTGLYYFHARYYDPVVGRFVGRDVAQKCLPGESPYLFCRNSPHMYADPTGKWISKLYGFQVVTEGFPFFGARCCKSEIETLGKETEDSCANVLRHLVAGNDRPDQLKVLQCISLRCGAGKITCRKDCPMVTGRHSCGNTYINNEYLDGTPGVLRPVQRVVVCPNFITGSAGPTSIHEWGHECGCDHDPKSHDEGDYKDGKPCDILPEGCGAEPKGF